MKFLCTLIGFLFMSTLSANDRVCYLTECDYSVLQIGANYAHANIKVEGQPSFHGNLGGIQGSYEYKAWNGFYGGVEATWRQGETKNDFAKRNLVYVDVQERLGYTFYFCCDTASLTLFSGFGYRFLSHKLKQDDQSSIKFDYNEFYLPIGFLSEYCFYSCISAGINFTWMPQVYPRVEISPLKGAGWILKNTVKNFLIELPLTCYVTPDRCYALILKPFYEHWGDGRSTAKTSTREALDLPRNAYNFWGVELNFTYSF